MSKNSRSKTEICNHEQTRLDPVLKVPMCISCFKVLPFNQSLVDASVNYTRCFARKQAEKSILKDVQGCNIPSEIVHEANQLYTKVTDGKTCRAKNRQGLIFACVFYAYQMAGKPLSLDQLNDKFDLPAKVISKGVKHVGLQLANTKMSCSYISAKELIPGIMSRFNADSRQISEVQLLFATVDGKSVILNRSKPQSVACGVIYYYIEITQRGIPLSEFSKTVELSELTIEKITREIKFILKR